MNNNIPLPDDNIAETSNINFNKKLSKKTPENPMKYFWIISFVAFIIKDLVVALPSSLYSWIIMFISFSSSVKGGNIDLSEQYPIWNVLDGVFSSIVIILFGILFVKYITNRTTFKGDIKKYRFFYYSWPFIVGGFVLDITGLVSSVILLNVQRNDVSVMGAGITLVLSSTVSVISFGVTILASYLCARLLNAAAFGDEKNQMKELRFLAICVTFSSIVSLIVYVVRIILLNDIAVLSIFVTVLSKLVSVTVIWIAATVKPHDLKSEKIIFTILPIIAICDSILYSIMDLLIV